jgi:hypothetical protein
MTIKGVLISTANFFMPKLSTFEIVDHVIWRDVLIFWAQYPYFLARCRYFFWRDVLIFWRVVFVNTLLFRTVEYSLAQGGAGNDRPYTT